MLALLTACGGGDSGSGNSGGSPPPPPPPGIGAAGGTVTGPSGSKVVVPAGALTNTVDVAITTSSTGAPALPAGLVALGSTYAFTPHGTSFSKEVTITVPFDPAQVPAGVTPVLYKTDASNKWQVVPGATVSSGTMSGNVTGFSWALVTLSKPVKHEWSSRAGTTPPGGRVEVIAQGTQIGGDLNLRLPYGDPQTVRPANTPADVAIAAVGFTAASSESFWVQAVAPHANATGTVLAPKGGVDTELTQTYTFLVEQDNPSVSFLLTHATIDATDQGGNLPSRLSCPQIKNIPPTAEELDSCGQTLAVAMVSFDLDASSKVDGGRFYSIGGDYSVNGSADQWQYTSSGGASNERRLWSDADFDATDDADGNGTHRHVRVLLKAPKTVPVPIQHLHKGDVFTVEVKLWALAENRIQWESFVGSYIRDPLQDTGISMTTSGLTLIPERDDIPATIPPATCAGGVDPAAGFLQLDAPDYSFAESAPLNRVSITRTGGTHGRVSVQLNMSDASAHAGPDYTSSAPTIYFADGEGGTRSLLLPLIDDATEEPDETFTLQLSNAAGCAQLGAQTSATVTILDDDTPVAPLPVYSLGGTVSGLVGSGLVLRDIVNGGSGTPGNGAFTLSGTVTEQFPYDVRVDQQPTNPSQQCTVTHGSGTATGNVNDIQVVCTVPPASGALDTSFGSGGRVTTTTLFSSPIVGAPVAMALQSDGRILLLGGQKLLRFNADGTPDTTFGSNGIVTISFKGSPWDAGQDVLVQPDGKIVVVGVTNSGGSNDDFALARFDTSGVLDASFGTGGKVSTDFNGSTDRARRVRLQADGKLVVAGIMTNVISPSLASQNIGVARYNADGSLDTTFGATGTSYSSAWGSYNVGTGLAIQPDGRIVIAGLTANDGVSDPDLGIVRYCDRALVDVAGSRDCLAGWLDPSFGWPDLVMGERTGAFHSDLHLGTGWEEAIDVVAMTDSTYALAARVPVGSAPGGRNFEFVLATCGADVVSTDCRAGPIVSFTGLSDSPRGLLRLADGRFVIVGRVGELSANPDMGIARFNATALSVDTSFGTDGKLTIDFFGGIDSAEAVVEQPDGKLVIGGYARVNGQTVLALARVTP